MGTQKKREREKRSKTILLPPTHLFLPFPPPMKIFGTTLEMGQERVERERGGGGGEVRPPPAAVAPYLFSAGRGLLRLLATSLGLCWRRGRRRKGGDELNFAAVKSEGWWVEERPFAGLLRGKGGGGGSIAD